LIVSKKLAKTLFLPEPKVPTRMMKKLKKEYGDVGRFPVLQRKTIGVS
jgi:hypothetical protein